MRYSSKNTAGVSLPEGQCLLPFFTTTIAYPYSDAKTIHIRLIFGIARKFPGRSKGRAGVCTRYPVRRSNVQPKAVVATSKFIILEFNL